MKMCHEKIETPKYGEMVRGNGAKVNHQSIKDALKWGKKDVSKNVCVLPVPCTCTMKMSSTESITALSRAVFLVHEKEKKNIKSQQLSFLSIFFCPAFQSNRLRGKDFSYFWL